MSYHIQYFTFLCKIGVPTTPMAYLGIIDNHIWGWKWVSNTQMTQMTKPRNGSQIKNQFFIWIRVWVHCINLIIIWAQVQIHEFHSWGSEHTMPEQHPHSAELVSCFQWGVWPLKMEVSGLKHDPSHLYLSPHQVPAFNLILAYMYGNCMGIVTQTQFRSGTMG